MPASLRLRNSQTSNSGRGRPAGLKQIRDGVQIGISATAGSAKNSTGNLKNYRRDYEPRFHRSPVCLWHDYPALPGPVRPCLPVRPDGRQGMGSDKAEASLADSQEGTMKSFNDWSEAFSYIRERNAPEKVKILPPAKYQQTQAVG